MRPVILCFLALTAVAAPVAAAEGTTFGIPDPWWKLVNLLIFLFALIWFIGRPLGRFLEDRRLGIRAALDEAQEKLERAEALRAEIAVRLERVESEVAEVRERAEREAQAEAEQLAAETGTEERRFLRRVEDEIERRTAETRRQLARDAVDLTAEMAKELLAKELTDADRARLLDKSLAAMGSLQRKG
jgi:F-type H+-transporting ATPase subunit b